MEDRDKIEEVIKEEIYKLRNLGEHERKGSDHLYYRSLIEFKMGKLKKRINQGQLNYEVICKYDVYMETEFLHTPEMDELYTEHYKDRFTLDKDYRLIEIKDMRKIK